MEWDAMYQQSGIRSAEMIAFSSLCFSNQRSTPEYLVNTCLNFLWQNIFVSYSPQKSSEVEGLWNHKQTNRGQHVKHNHTMELRVGLQSSHNPQKLFFSFTTKSTRQRSHQEQSQTEISMKLAGVWPKKEKKNTILFCLLRLSMSCLSACPSVSVSYSLSSFCCNVLMRQPMWCTHPLVCASVCVPLSSRMYRETDRSPWVRVYSM